MEGIASVSSGVAAPMRERKSSKEPARDHVSAERALERNVVFDDEPFVPAANLLNEAQISAKDQLVQNIGADCPQILFARERQEADHGPITPSIWGMSV